MLETTPQPGDAGYQMYLAAVQAEGTLEAARAQMTATAEAQQATATAQAQQYNATATERAWISAQATASVQGTSTAIAQQNTLQAAAAMSTATAQYQATQDYVALQQTQQAMNINATMDAAAAAAVATSQAAQAEVSHLAAERERMMNRVAAATPWAMGVLTFLVAAFLLIRWVRVEVDRRRVIRNADNNPDWWLPDTQNPTVIVPGRLIGAGATVSDEQIRTTPATPYQMQVTTMAQLIELLRQIPPEKMRSSGISRRELINNLLTQAMTPPQISAGEIIDVQVVDVSDPEVRNWVSDVEDTFQADTLL